MMMIITIMIIIISVAFWMSVAVSVKDSNLSATNSQVCVCYKKGNFEEKKKLTKEFPGGRIRQKPTDYLSFTIF